MPSLRELEQIMIRKGGDTVRELELELAEAEAELEKARLREQIRRAKEETRRLNGGMWVK